MNQVVWVIRRLRAMQIAEVAWRLSQKRIQRKEKKRFFHSKNTVVDQLFYDDLQGLELDENRMHLNLDNKEFTLSSTIPLLGAYKYEQYKNRWNAGFQTENLWPDIFSYSLKYKQRDDIGDARTNWELNRHFQFAILAKDYYVSSKKKYLNELVSLFRDWNQKNPFLWGISWTSVMEVAIRCSNWCYTYVFLAASQGVPNLMLKQLKIGILNMTRYIEEHYSRFSSANNHLIVEMYAIGQSGVLFNNQKWIDLAVSVLGREFSIQNYSDGINKELSLHYQSFYMEAVGLMMRLLGCNGIKIPQYWYFWLSKMSEYMATCKGEYGEVIEFGDNDEGKILDLCGGFNYYEYVLGLMSCLLGRQYTDLNGASENLRWLFTEEERIKGSKRDKYVPQKNTCYREGGNTILRSIDNKVLIGIDHAELGFGSIAAHGHADALSFQMFIKGNPFFVDPGTYIYHCNIEKRDEFRSTKSHNTVCIEGKNQSEMLGAFLWGKRAKCQLIDYMESEKMVEVKACHDGYFPVMHTRTFQFNCKDELIIYDKLSKNSKMALNFILAPGVDTKVLENMVYLSQNDDVIKFKVQTERAFKLTLLNVPYSKRYGICCISKCIHIETESDTLAIMMRIEGAAI